MGGEGDGDGADGVESTLGLVMLHEGFEGCGSSEACCSRLEGGVVGCGVGLLVDEEESGLVSIRAARGVGGGNRRLGLGSFSAHVIAIVVAFGRFVEVVLGYHELQFRREAGPIGHD